MNPDFWKGKKTFITGHTGFKGSWLSLLLQGFGAELTGYALEPLTDPNLFERAGVAKGMHSIVGNVCDLESLTSALKESQPDIVIHMAAQSLVIPSYNQPLETYATNVMGTAHLLEAVRSCSPTRVVIVVTSDKCYENKEWDWGYRENEPVGGLDPYSSSKGCAELVTAAYRHSFFENRTSQADIKGIASVRAGNVIGGGDWAPNRLIPDMVNAFLKKQAVTIRNPDSIRPWQHVLDPLNGYLVLAEHLWEKPAEFSGAWNFGPLRKDEQKVSWIVDRLVKIWGDNTSWELDSTAHPHESKTLRLDCSKANIHINWIPRLNLEEALGWTVEWYKVFENRGNLRKITEEQINRFQSLA